MDPAYSPRPTSSRSSSPVEKVKCGKDASSARAKLVGDMEAGVMPMIAVDDVIDPETGEVYLDAGKPFTADKVDKIIAVAHQRSARRSRSPKDPIILNSLNEDGRPRCSHEAALLKIYQRLRPGNPAQLEKAKELFREKFQDANRYRLGRVGRFRINRKFDQNVPETEMTLRSVDFVNSIKYLLSICGSGKGAAWTTSTTSATAACGPSTNWPPTNSARASSSSAAPCRSAWRSATSRT